MIANIKEENYGWVINFHNCIVQMIQIDFRLGLFLRDGDDALELQVETPFNLVSADRSVICVPEIPKSLAPILSLANLKVISLQIRRKGQMHIEFDADFSINIDPDPAYEAWQLSGSSGFLFACPPEGNVTFFRKSSE